MSHLPSPFSHEPASVIEPERECEYETCPECGEQAFDLDACGACDFYVPMPEPTPESRVRAQAYMDQVLARARDHAESCDQCDGPSALSANYPIYHDYTGVLLGGYLVKLCVSCFNERHDEGGVDPFFGPPSEVRYT